MAIMNEITVKIMNAIKTEPMKISVLSFSISNVKVDEIKIIKKIIPKMIGIKCEINARFA